MPAKHLKIKWRDKVTNKEPLWRRVGQEPMEMQIIRRKWRWLGHTTPTKTVPQALRWNPQGRRKRGRPRVVHMEKDN